MMRTVVVKYLNDALGAETFHDAEVLVIQPGLIVVQNAQKDRLGIFPLGSVSVLFPDGPNRVSGVTL